MNKENINTIPESKSQNPGANLTAPSNPKVSIIILNWKGLKDTIECLESIKKSDYPNYEIILVDNGSLNEETDIIRHKFPETLIIKNNDNLGFTGGNNIGTKRALENGAQYVWLLNNDAVVEPNTLKELIRIGEEDFEIGLLSPVIHYYDSPDKIQSCGSYLDDDNLRITLLKNPNDKKINSPSLVLWGTALLIKRQVIEKIGYLDEKLFAYYEDSDYSLRSLKNGFKNKVVVTSKIFHKTDVDPQNKKPAYYYFYMVRNEYFFWKENRAYSSYFSFLRKYIAKNLRRIGSLKEESRYENINASLEGIFCALRNIGGKWDKNKHMPNPIIKLACWHSYFLADLLEGNFKKIFIELTKRMKIGTYKPCQK